MDDQMVTFILRRSKREEKRRCGIRRAASERARDGAPTAEAKGSRDQRLFPSSALPRSPAFANFGLFDSQPPLDTSLDCSFVPSLG